MKMGRLAVAAIALLLAFVCEASDRVALIIGNDEYAGQRSGTASADAQDIAKSLQDIGFSVALHQNASRIEMIEALRQFAQAAKGANAAVFYFAGRSVRWGGKSFMLPANTPLARRPDAPYLGVDSAFTADMEGARFKFVLFDLPLEHPVEGQAPQVGERWGGDPLNGWFYASVSSVSGANQQPAQRNSIFAKNLLEALKLRDVPAELMFNYVRQGVERDSGWKIKLNVSSTLNGPFTFNPSGSTSPSLAAVPIAPSPAGTRENRVALVIGNSKYESSPLLNPVNDASDMAKALQAAGFKVSMVKDGTTRQMRQAIRQFGNDLRRADAGLFYFAGHGVQVRGNNFLVPVGEELASEADVEDFGIDASYVLRTMEESQVKVSIMILDACRDNPYTRVSRSSARGLAQMIAASGTLIAFATAPGSTAADGNGRNGLYTAHLLQSMKEGDGDVLKIFQRTRAAVMKSSSGRQVPWESTSLVGDFYLGAGRPTTAK
jgi:uncharacterized caspase-like protein